jgi:cytidyltransferase-like protein
MFLHELFESSSKKVLVVYPGRFQPFHKGHAAVFAHLSKQYGQSNVFIVTSDKVDPPKSPFSFDEKKKMMILTGIPADRVVFDTQPYRALSLIQHYDANNTILLFAVSEKDMAEDPRFQFKPKKDGSPSYFQKFTNINQCKPLSTHGYITTVPTFNFTVLGEPANSATQIRAQFASSDLETQKKIVADLFGKFDPIVLQIMQNKIA